MYLYGTGIILGSFYSIMSVHLCSFNILHTAMQIRVALSAAIYRKLLRLTHDAQNEASIGHILNIFSNDLHRFEISMMGTPYVLASPFVILICGYILWTEVGVAVFAGFGILMLLGPVQCK